MKSSSASLKFRTGPPSEFASQAAASDFVSETPPEKRFKVQNLFAFKRGRGDLFFSLLMLGFVAFLLFNFNTESGWENRKLPQKRVGKILKQSWVGPMICMAILVPAAVINLWQSLRKWRRDQRQLVPNKWRYELSQWARSFEFILYFLAYTFVISYLGYLLSTLLFALFLTQRLGYRGWRWAGRSLAAAFGIVLLFRTILQIKTPINIWLYDQLPLSLENFMKVYF